MGRIMSDVMASARLHERAWALRQEHMMRNTKAVVQGDRLMYGFGEMQRAAARAVMIMQRKHLTFSTCASCPPPAPPLRRLALCGAQPSLAEPPRTARTRCRPAVARLQGLGRCLQRQWKL